MCALDLAEVFREFDLLVVGDVLIVEHQHRVTVHAGIDRGSLLAGQRLSQIDAGHLAGEHGMDLADREHGRASKFLLAAAIVEKRVASASRWQREKARQHAGASKTGW